MECNPTLKESLLRKIRVYKKRLCAQDHSNGGGNSGLQAYLEGKLDNERGYCDYFKASEVFAPEAEESEAITQLEQCECKEGETTRTLSSLFVGEC